MKKILLAVLTLALALGSSMPVFAATQTTTMPVSVTIAAAVTVSATGLNFGTIAPSASNVLGNATITVNASNGTPYTVTMDAGLNIDSGIRKLMSGATVGGSYHLYRDAAYIGLWGDTGFANTYDGGPGLSGTGSGADQTLTVYGQLWATATPGTFTDTVTVTVHY